ncbi:MAG: cyclic lactone autoinducer peptide [Lachnospiraceae bacterium]|nr:cyclic lactone autoinducer peptide [Lachnospiraceae bacterium]
MNTKKKSKDLLVKIATKYATRKANEACPWVNYQEKLPKSIDNLRKYK